MIRPIALALCLIGAPSAQAAETKIGQLAPIFVMSTLDGQDFNLSLLRGKVILVNYWATWCPPCLREQPLLNRVYKRYHDRGLEMIGVSEDAASDRPAVVKMKPQVPYPVAMADDAKINDFKEPETLPATFLIDRHGILRQIFTNQVAELSEKDLDRAIKPLLGEPTR